MNTSPAPPFGATSGAASTTPYSSTASQLGSRALGITQPIPATYLRDKLRAAQSAFPHLDLRLPGGWWSMTDDETQELWEEKCKEFGFHSYARSIRIADEMIRRYDDKAEAGGFQSAISNTPTLRNVVLDLSAVPNNGEIANASFRYQAHGPGKSTDAKSNFSAPRKAIELEASPGEAEMPEASSNLPLFGDRGVPGSLFGDVSETASGLYLSGEVDVFDTEPSVSLYGEEVKLVPTEHQDFRGAASTISNAPGNPFILTLGDPADIPARSAYSVYSESSPSSSSVSLDPTVVRDGEWVTDRLQITEDGMFFVYTESQKEDFNMWWERTIWAEETGYGKHRHPNWDSRVRTALVWRKFTQVADRLTGEPGMMCDRCGANFAHPRTARYGGTWPLECHLQSVDCRSPGMEVVQVQATQSPIKQFNPGFQSLTPNSATPDPAYTPNPAFPDQPRLTTSVQQQSSPVTRPSQAPILGIGKVTKDRPAPVTKPSHVLSPHQTVSPDREPGHITLTPKNAELTSRGKRKFPVIDTEFGAAIKLAKKEYIEKHGLTPPKGSRKLQ
ncbi:MAG: hypothetical protein M1839_008279 [Geoglossum umbratile]|nr:MAG: hypothetical protein M1839_008279 [Geoglossum umbratile]